MSRRDAMRAASGSDDHPDLDTLLAAYDYSLPTAAIAQEPAEPRDSSRLLVLQRANGGIVHTRFRDLPRWLAPHDLLVANDTRVIPARLFGRKSPGGGRAEILLLRSCGTHLRWEALLRLTGRLRPGLCIELAGGYVARTVKPAAGQAWELELSGPGPVEEWLGRVGCVPLPPYIRRPADSRDAHWYQTVYARQPGAVAAPTAGLHFTAELLATLRAADIGFATVTLHVGPGTFQPLRAEDLELGELHAEEYDLPEETAAAIDRTRAAGGRVIAVGTTSARVLEACALPGRRVRAARGRTRLFIRPPYVPAITDALVTNFHLPRTSLLLLVAAFAGRERILAAYAEALAQGYRFYSYGDAMLIL